MKKANEASEWSWDVLLDRIHDKECTPFIGADDCTAGIPSASEIARNWAEKHRYPLIVGDEDLARVAQFITVQNHDSMIAREWLAKALRGTSQIVLAKDDPHRVLARLPIPIYITTNYHTLMTRALEAEYKTPVAECYWPDEKMAKEYAKLHKEKPYLPDVANPCVFHLFGKIENPRSLVLTEDDYLDFLIQTSAHEDLIPQQVRAAVAHNSLLFIGYDPRDFEFRVLLRCLATQLSEMRQRLSVSIDVVDKVAAKPTMAETLRDYLAKYCRKLHIHVHWSSPKEFMNELERRWKDYESRR